MDEFPETNVLEQVYVTAVSASLVGKDLAGDHAKLSEGLALLLSLKNTPSRSLVPIKEREARKADLHVSKLRLPAAPARARPAGGGAGIRPVELGAWAGEGRCSGPAPARSPPSPSPRVVATRSGGGCSASPLARAVAIAEGSLPSSPGARGARLPLGLAVAAAALQRGSSFRPASPSSACPAPRAAPRRLQSPPGARTEAPRWGGDHSSPGVSVQAGRDAGRRSLPPSFSRPGRRQRPAAAYLPGAAPGQPPPACLEPRLPGRWLIVCSVELFSSASARNGKLDGMAKSNSSWTQPCPGPCRATDSAHSRSPFPSLSASSGST